MSVRFAPSPTGAFHVGNFRTAWISWQWARELGLPWVVRFEDIDGPRVVPGAMERQRAEMESLGLRADRVLVQSEFIGRHWETFVEAIRERQVYPCYCSRKDVRDALEGAASAPHAAVALYHGQCRNRTDAPAHSLPSLAWRFRAADESGAGDFIVGRTSPRLNQGLPEQDSFMPAYNWACAVDDYDGAHTLLVRAADLASVTGQQRAVQEWLARLEGKAFRFPAVFHCALVTQNDGQRLEKRTRGVTLPELLAGGRTSEKIIERFRVSFLEKMELPAPGAVLGEKREQLTLREVGF